jgi:hypothetical protein
MHRQIIPAFLSFDIEPDGFQLPGVPPLPRSAGYDAIFEFAKRLRTDLTQRSGNTPIFGWYFRTDPQIAEVYGQADYLLTAHPDRISWLKSKGDYFGVHPHPLRWCEERQLWVHEFADSAWMVHCTRYSLEAFSRWAESPAERTRWGAGLLTNEVVAATEQCGVKVDLTLEPVARGEPTHIHTLIDRSPTNGAYTDCSTAPRVPYYPAHDDFRMRDSKRGRTLLLVPLSSGYASRPRPLWWRMARRLIRGPSPSPIVTMFYPFAEWPSEQFYWDVVERQLASMRRPYLSLAIRTDVEGSAVPARIRRLFEALLQHPVSKRLQFVDPLDVAPSLI